MTMPQSPVPEFKHREVLKDPGFLRERLSARPQKDFEDISSAYTYTVTVQLADWDRELGPESYRP
ncbi:hypothetical protein BON30_23845 [Cystobacter ferrugineus]|uniref:Uncharacterized protein n=1 Tax=Cystobacter ferrugineus TaxID=83449 RepID=A0A1L9B7E8_9BACT|nr:hypothetical protein BON30_23845 [Cystobacter ferrugineus]